MCYICCFFFFKQKTAYEMLIRDWSADVCSSDLLFTFGDRLSWRYRMGGMIPDWTRFSDPINSVHRPAQMAPVWFHVGRISGMPIDGAIWLDDPPGSSYPASIAVQAAA